MIEMYMFIKGKIYTTQSREEWAAYMSDSADHRRVAETFVGDTRISTVFLGIDHGWGGAKILFETMIFTADPDNELDQTMDRYATLEAAMAGHERAVALVRQTVGNISIDKGEGEEFYKDDDQDKLGGQNVG